MFLKYSRSLCMLASCLCRSPTRYIYNICSLIKELILLWNGFRILYKRPDLVKNLLELVHESQRKQSCTRSDGEIILRDDKMFIIPYARVFRCNELYLP